MSIKVSRRTLLKALAALVPASIAGAWVIKREPTRISGRLLGPNANVGHLLRDAIGTEPSSVIEIDTVIVGGGISGLSAAWWLQKNGKRDFILLEMETEVGGNSRAGENKISKYPWGAHYVPLPGPDAHYVREFFEETGVIKGYAGGLPVFDEYYLCADPHERLFFQGEWQDGLVPQHGVQPEDRAQYDQFFTYVETLKKQNGRDGRPLFNIPLDHSSKDSDFTALDRMSMAEFMLSRGWNSKTLNWYVNYCCRDDYGVDHSRVSAWVGLHYFASRSGVGANADAQSVITWPEGNGWLTSKLAEIAKSYTRSGALVYSIANGAQSCTVDSLDVQTRAVTRYHAKHVIYCGPRFTAGHVIRDYQGPSPKLDFAPWIVANISVNERPSGHGAPLSWDNVSYYSDSLGYIFANHQDLTSNRHAGVMTYYLPLDKLSPKEERTLAAKRSFDDWAAIILPDLEKMHPGISSAVTNIDVWLWGHGMVSPGIDYIWSRERDEMRKPFGRIHFAHTDMTGISIFEEAQYRGVEAAKAILG